MKNAFELQFHWIFILFAGAAILAFFFSIVAQQKRTSDDELARTISEDLEALFTGASLAKRTAQHVEIPKAGIEFSCSDTCACTMSVGRAAVSFKEKYLFAPASVEEADLLLWTVDWKLPFRGGNFVYATNERVMYFLVYDPAVIESTTLLAKITTSLPPGITAKNVTVQAVKSLRNQAYPSATFVFLNTNTVDLAQQLDTSFLVPSVRAVRLTSDSLLFFANNGKEWSTQASSYASDAELFGSLFGDHQMYVCNLRQAYDRMNIIVQVYQQRLSQIATPRCAYTRAQDLLNALAAATKGMSATIGTPSFDLGLFRTIREIMRQLEDENRKLLLASCPQIY